MATYDLTDYLTADNMSWYQYSLSGGFVPLAVFNIPMSYNSSDAYSWNYTTVHDLPAFKFPSCAEVIQTGIGTITYQNNFYYNLSDRYFYFGKDKPSDNMVHIYIHPENDNTTQVLSTYAGFTDPNHIVASGVGFSFIRFSNGFIFCCGTISYSVEPGVHGDIIDPIPLDSSKKGSLDIKNAFYVNVIASNAYWNSTYRASHEIFEAIIGSSSEFNPDNPYQGGDDSNNPGAGTFNYSSDTVPVPGLPTTSVVDSGLVSLYAPTPEELQALGNYLWSDAFSVDTFKKMFNNPMDCILGLSLIPVHVPTGESKEITVGNIVSTVSCTVCTSQYVEVNCGTFTFNRSNFTGSFLDYSPYLKCFLFLPFIGMNEIDMDEWQNSTMGVVYHVDVLTGAMFCFVTRNGSVIMTYSGQCSENVPLSSNDFSTTISSILGVASTAVGAVATVATAGAAAPAAAAAGGLSEAALGARTGASLTGAGVSTASQVGSMKPSIRHSGCVGGGAGIMGVKAPYLLFIAPHMATPNDQNKYTGFSSNKIVQLSSCSGYTEIQAINLHIKNANDQELAEIENGLKTGVIL